MDHAELDLVTALQAGELDALRFKLGEPAGFPNVVLENGETLLAMAIYHGPVALVERLLAEGADPNYPVMDGFPSLIAAMSVRSGPELLAILQCLLVRGADPNRRGLNGWTSLHYAVTQIRDPAVARLLMEHGADPSVRTNVDDHATPLEEAELLGAEVPPEVRRLLDTT